MIYDHLIGDKIVPFTFFPISNLVQLPHFLFTHEIETFISQGIGCTNVSRTSDVTRSLAQIRFFLSHSSVRHQTAYPTYHSGVYPSKLS